MRRAARAHSRDTALTLPAAVRASLERALGERDAGAIETALPVGGGCISPTARIHTESGAEFFVKWSDGALPAGLFLAESRSLGILAGTGAVRVPRVHGVRDAAGDPARWLLLEWLEPGPATTQTWQRLGRQLAALHRVSAERAGWPRDNFIGSLPQANGSAADWSEFWRTRRLEPQLRRAHDAGALSRSDRRRFDALLRELDFLLAPANDDGNSLLHGDLWRGNLHILRSGEPALVDPSCYFGHREVDLAICRLFGGFEPSFHEAYDESWPPRPERSRRLAIYQLYYLLVHVNLFGASYRAQTLDALARAGF